MLHRGAVQRPADRRTEPRRQRGGRHPAADRCPHTGRARLSYRRAAELFIAHTSALGPGWTLRQLRERR
ncbi:hypothetical protein CP971_18565 [Streptomyces viridifaciens]|nr:hypothetical protein CP971_18565 [Streptomyces viridifaciens]